MLNLVPVRKTSNVFSPASLDRFFDTPFFRYFDDGTESRRWNPAVEVFESEGELNFSLEVPGLDKEDLKIDVENGHLTISGEKKLETEEAKEYFRRERFYGKFSRTFRLPDTVDTEKIKANLTNGVLRISMPRKEEAKPKQIEVKVS
jgi:HSP20 family protein